MNFVALISDSSSNTVIKANTCCEEMSPHEAQK
jgi:hypothetical protein